MEDLKSIARLPDVYANAAGTWINGQKLTSGEFISILVRPPKKIDEKYPEPTAMDPTAGWIPIGLVKLIDTVTGIVVRVRAHGPFLVEMCPYLELISISEITYDAEGEHCQLEIVKFSHEWFRIDLVRVDSKRSRLL